LLDDDELQSVKRVLADDTVRTFLQGKLNKQVTLDVMRTFFLEKLKSHERCLWLEPWVEEFFPA